MALNKASPTSNPTSGLTETSSAKPFPASLSPAVSWRISWKDWIRTRLHVQMVPSLGFWRPVQNSYVGFYRTSSTLAWVRRKFQSCERHPVLFRYLKKSHVSSLSDNRPVVLTSHVIKALERLLLVHLNKHVKSFQDPLQFAFCPEVGVEDAIIELLQQAHSHMDKVGSMVRIMFFDFPHCF